MKIVHCRIHALSGLACFIPLICQWQCLLVESCVNKLLDPIKSYFFISHFISNHSLINCLFSTTILSHNFSLDGIDMESNIVNSILNLFSKKMGLCCNWQTSYWERQTCFNCIMATNSCNASAIWDLWQSNDLWSSYVHYWVRYVNLLSQSSAVIYMRIVYAFWPSV